jgi:hypothetical protein
MAIYPELFTLVTRKYNTPICQDNFLKNFIP